MRTYIAVYELIVSGDVVYIGCTANPERRRYAHMAHRPLGGWPELNVISYHRTRRAALRVEKRLIRERMPPLNLQHTGRKRPGRMDAEKASKIWHGSKRKTNAECLALMPGWTIWTARSYLGKRKR